MSICPSESSGIVTTSAILSRQEISLLWCSKGPIKTTGRSFSGIDLDRFHFLSKSAGIRMLSIPINLSIAPVLPEPAKITASSTVAPTAERIIFLASSRNLVVCKPVPLDSVCVFAYLGITSSRMKSSINAKDRPLAV